MMKVNKNRPSEYDRFMALSDAEKDAEVAKYDRGADLRETKPLTPAQRKLWSKAKRKRGRPRLGKGVEVISLSVEKDLLRKADQMAESEGISRAAVFARGLQAMLRKAS
jgi:hypothetical protein